MLKDVDVASLQTQLQALGDTAAAQYAREFIEQLRSQVQTQQKQIAYFGERDRSFRFIVTGHFG